MLLPFCGVFWSFGWLIWEKQGRWSIGELLGRQSHFQEVSLWLLGWLLLILCVLELSGSMWCFWWHQIPAVEGVPCRWIPQVWIIQNKSHVFVLYVENLVILAHNLVVMFCVLNRLATCHWVFNFATAGGKMLFYSWFFISRSNLARILFF